MLYLRHFFELRKISKLNNKQIALIILIGISTKNSILIVDYANRIRATGKDIKVAVKEACSARFRPIIMTSLSTMSAMLPLVIGNIGPGAGEG